MAIIYTAVSADPSDTNLVLLWLCLLVTLRGLYKSVKVLRRVSIERRRAIHGSDHRLQLIAGENVRRHRIQVAKLLAFLVIIVIPLSGHSNTLLSRSLLLLILFLVSGQAELDDDAISDFDSSRYQHDLEAPSC